MTTDTTTSAASVAATAKAPLRNRIRVELWADPTKVWELMGDLARFPEYSFGLAQVDLIRDSDGTAARYVCHFKPMEEGGEFILHNETFTWYEENTGWASVADEPNPFGLSNSLTLVSLQAVSQGTVMKWDQHYDAEELEFTKTTVFDNALVDIADRLIARFGGQVLERYVEQ